MKTCLLHLCLVYVTKLTPKTNLEVTKKKYLRKKQIT